MTLDFLVQFLVTLVSVKHPVPETPGCSSSFVTQRHHGIDLRRAARGDVTRQRCGDQYDEGHARNGQRVLCGYAEQKAANQTTGRQCRQ